MLPVAALMLSMTTQEICPAEIHTTQRATAPQGWEAANAYSRHILQGFRLYQGHPSASNDILPRVTRAAHLHQSLRFDIPKGAKSVWIDCAYSFTSVVMRKELRAPIRKCEADLDISASTVDSISCE